jgi:hypothetical protein
MMRFLTRLIPLEENKLIKQFRNGNPQPLIDYFNRPSHMLFKVGARDYASKTFRVTVCDDIYGYEVKIDNGELLDCCPSYYGLTKETADQLYTAILSNLPGTTCYDLKFKDTFV